MLILQRDVFDSGDEFNSSSLNSRVNTPLLRIGRWWLEFLRGTQPVSLTRKIAMHFAGRALPQSVPAPSCQGLTGAKLSSAI